MKKYTCPKCGSSRTVGDLVVAGDVGCGCRVSGYSIEYTDEDSVRKYPDQVLRNKDTSMKLPEKLRVPILWGHTRDNVKVVYENIPEVRAAETINQILDYLAKGEKQVSGPTLGVSSNYGPVTTVPSLPHEPVVSNTPLFKVPVTVSVRKLANGYLIGEVYFATEDKVVTELAKWIKDPYANHDLPKYND